MKRGRQKTIFLSGSFNIKFISAIGNLSYYVCSKKETIIKKKDNYILIPSKLSGHVKKYCFMIH